VKIIICSAEKSWFLLHFSTPQDLLKSQNAVVVGNGPPFSVRKITIITTTTTIIIMIS